jgi:hypothetical protein
MTSDPRIDRLEVAVDGLRSDVQNLRSEVNSRLNTLTIVVFGNVAVTILSAVGLVVAVLIKG